MIKSVDCPLRSANSTGHCRITTLKPLRRVWPVGKLVLVGHKAEDRRVPIKPLHKMSEERAKREMRALGFKWEKTRDDPPQQHVLIFTKPE